MTPSQVKDVISKTKKYHTADREEGTDELGKLGCVGRERRGREGCGEGCVGREEKGGVCGE